ncbi:MAG: hypothetical protein K2I63_00375, partial [Helicobacter sp.]|nr:hypothetical protein [Helicobacter sp.]
NRLYLLVDGASAGFIVDYKSGKPDSTHAIQIQEYSQSIQKILKKQVHGYIFYTQNQGKLVEII